MTTASTYKQRQDIIQGAPCPNCGALRWARAGDDGVQCQECDGVFKVRTLWAEMSDLPVTQPDEPEVHLEHPDFAAMVVEYARLDRAERRGSLDASWLIDRSRRLQRLEDVLPADVCAAVQVLNDRATHEEAFSAAELPGLPPSNG